MKKRLIVCALHIVAIFVLCACGFSQQNEAQAYEKTQEDEIELLREELAHCEEVIQYYESLCDYYGYLTYESVYDFELWSNFIDSETNIIHDDWLCDRLDRSHKGVFVTDNSVSVFEDCTECPVCVGVETVFLDEIKRIFHSEKYNLDLGTDDYVSHNINYRLVSAENALKNGYSKCDCCNFGY